jgi:cell division inhibitor SulA/protein ImuA
MSAAVALAVAVPADVPVLGAVVGPVALADVLARGDVWRGDALARLPDADAVVASGYADLDAELPGGGWPRGNLTEILVDRSGLGEMSLLLPALARLSGEGWVALVAPPWLPHAPAWAAAGLALERLVIVRPGRDLAWSVEQLLASGGFAGVVAWPEAGIDAKSLRRLQVAAEGRPVFACLWRPSAAAAQPSPAPLRLALAAGERHLVVRVLKRRGRPASRPLQLAVPRPGRERRAVAGPAFSAATARSPAAATLA